MKIRILSDLHINRADFVPPAAESDLVVLAGDVNVGTQGIDWAAKAFSEQPVIYVLGNHEYYGHSFSTLPNELQAQATGTQIQVLERGIARIGNVTVLGCTLWTDLAFTGNAPEAATALAPWLGDYRCILSAVDGPTIVPADTLTLHRESVAWLRHARSQAGGRCVVVTHHAPSPRSLGPGFFRHPAARETSPGAVHRSAAYVSSLEALVEELDPLLWIHGHIHTPADYHIARTRVVCNPRGYPEEARWGGNVGFRPDLVVEV
jgi:predicted phosphodiesterase